MYWLLVLASLLEHFPLTNLITKKLMERTHPWLLLQGDWLSMNPIHSGVNSTLQLWLVMKFQRQLQLRLKRILLLQIRLVPVRPRAPSRAVRVRADVPWLKIPFLWKSKMRHFFWAVQGSFSLLPFFLLCLGINWTRWNSLPCHMYLFFEGLHPSSLCRRSLWLFSRALYDSK